MSDFRQTVSETGDSSQKLIGIITQADIASLYSKSHFVVFPSYYGEGVPKVLLEACASGRPIITTNTPGCNDVVIDGYNGTEQLGLASYFSRNLPYNGKLNINEVSFEEALQFVKALYFPPYRGAIFVIDKNEEVEVKSIDDLIKIKEKS